MPLDRSPTDHVTHRDSFDHRARTIVDERGTEWEVYDDGTWSIQLALDWDSLPQTSNPGLFFVSSVERRRLWPCPDTWKALGDSDLLGLLSRAKSIS